MPSECIKEEFLNSDDRKVHASRTYLFMQGDKADRVYYIAEGLVKITRSDALGRELTVALRSAGDLIGLAEVFIGRTRDCSAFALENAETYELDESSFKERLSASNDLSLAVNKELSVRLREAENMLFSFGLDDARRRFCKLLLHFAEAYSDESEYGLRINKELTHQELAYIVGTSRQTVTSLLNELQKKEIIEVKKKTIYISDLNRLKTL